METAEEVLLRLYREVYFDFNMRHFHEKLLEERKIRVSYTWVQQALQGAGLAAKRRKRGPHQRRREPGRRFSSKAPSNLWRRRYPTAAGMEPGTESAWSFR
jgi:hypothetical protein